MKLFSFSMRKWFSVSEFYTGSWSAEAKAAAQRRCVVLYPNCTENGGQSCQRYEYCEPGSHYCFTAWSQNNASANGKLIKMLLFLNCLVNVHVLTYLSSHSDIYYLAQLRKRVIWTLFCLSDIIKMLWTVIA